MYTSELTWQPSEMSNSLQFDKKGTLGGKNLIQGHIEVRFEPRFLSSRILFSTACHHKTWKAYTRTPATAKITLCFCCVGMHRNAQSLLVSLYPYCFVFVPLQSSCLIEQRFLLLWDSFLEEFLKVPAYWESSVRTSVEVSGKLISTLSTTGLPFL